jgi:hypothetical protein
MIKLRTAILITADAASRIAPSNVWLFVEDEGAEHGGDDGAERVEHGRVERAPHRYAPRLQVERHA